MRLWFLLLTTILGLTGPSLAEELVGKVVSVKPEKGEIIISTPTDETQKIFLKDLKNLRLRPGDWVKLDLRKRQGKVSVSGLKVLRRYDRTGVRRRLKMRRGFRGHGRH